MSDETCGFGRAWIGPCDQPKPCPEHANRKCASCGSPATHECDATNGLVCGAPLCAECEHELDERGTSGGMRHCRIGEQKYTPWYTRKRK